MDIIKRELILGRVGLKQKPIPEFILKHKAATAFKIRDVIAKYNQLLEAVSAILGHHPKGFQGLANKIAQLIRDNEELPPPAIEQPAPAAEIVPEIAKESSTYLNKMLLKFNPSNLDRMKLEIIETIKSIREAIDQLMDDLEDRKREIASLNQKFDK